MANVLLAATIIDSSGTGGTLADIHDGSNAATACGFAPAGYIVFDLGAAYVISDVSAYFGGSTPGETLTADASNASDMSGAVTLGTIPADSAGAANDSVSNPTAYRYLRFTASNYMDVDEIEADGATGSSTHTPGRMIGFLFN